MLRPAMKAQPWKRCETCNGNAKVPRRLSRKGKRKHSSEAIRVVQDPCQKCGGTGLCPGVCEITTDLRIGVVGGGIGGLALAAALCHRGIRNVSVWERDDTFDARRQGYGLTMQQAAPQLQALGVPLPLYGGIHSTKHIVHAADGTVCGQWGRRHWMGADGETPKQNNKRQNVHIPRQMLRQELLYAVTAMDPDIVKWNHRLLSLDDTSSGSGVVCRFSNIDEEGVSHTFEKEFDVVVGADGIRSTVRSQLISEERTPLRYLGCIVILGICEVQGLDLDSNSSFGHLLDGETVFQTADGTTRIYMMPFSSSQYMWQLSFPMAEQEATLLSKGGSQCLLTEALRRCSGWHSPVHEVLASTPIELVSGYPVYDRDLLAQDHFPNVPRRRGVLLGDAAHPMSPFKGQGANQALLDALSLARHLHTHKDLQTAILEFEKEMIQRSSVKVKASAEAARFLHTDVAIEQGDITRGGAASKH